MYILNLLLYNFYIGNGNMYIVHMYFIIWFDAFDATNVYSIVILTRIKCVKMRWYFALPLQNLYVCLSNRMRKRLLKFYKASFPYTYLVGIKLKVQNNPLIERIRLGVTSGQVFLGRVGWYIWIYILISGYR